MTNTLHLRGYLLGAGLLVSASALADNGAMTDSYFDQGLVYYSQGQYQQALAQFHQAVNAGETGADYMLMKMHAEGLVTQGGAQNGTRDVAKDASAAFKWAQKAAESGIAQAQFRLAEMYANGTGTTTDHQKAVHWYRAAARQYHPLAIQQLAHHYETGLGVAKNQVEADRWYGVAASELDVFAQKGDAGSQNRLANLYEQGKGVKTNPPAAANWYRKAALQGLADAQFNLGRLLAYGDIERNLNEAIYWLQMAAKSGHQDARVMLATVTEAAQSEVAFIDQQYD